MAFELIQIFDTLEVTGTLSASVMRVLNILHMEESSVFSGSLIPITGGKGSLGKVEKPFKDVFLSSGSLFIDGRKVLSIDEARGIIVLGGPNNEDVLINASGSGKVIITNELKVPSGSIIAPKVETDELVSPSGAPITGSLFGTASFADTADAASVSNTAIAALVVIPVTLFMEKLQLIEIPESITDIEDPASKSVGDLDLTNHIISRLSISVNKKAVVSPGRPRIAIQFSVDGGTTFDFLDGVDGPYVDISGSTTGLTRVAGPNVTHVSESRTGVALRLVAYSGSATPPFESPTVQGLLWTISPGAF